MGKAYKNEDKSASGLQNKFFGEKKAPAAATTGRKKLGWMPWTGFPTGNRMILGFGGVDPLFHHP